MKYSQEMILKSPSGYCMPFEERDKEVDMTLGYGKQRAPLPSFGCGQWHRVRPRERP